MRHELYSRNILDPQQFLTEATQKAVQSQEREGLHHPLFEEAAETWENRKGLVVDQLTDFYFASNLNFDLLNELILAVLTERGVDSEKVLYEFNPETAPLELLFNQGMMIEKMSASERAPYEARLREIKVVLIRNMISDQLRYINIAKDWFTISDLAEIRRHKLGHGRIGGKAAGMILASRILKEKANPKLKETLRTPVSFYLGSDLFYTFLSVNNLLHWNDQKYKDEEQMRHDYPLIVEDFIKGDFTPFVLQYMETILSAAGDRPLIVRSSSLLEDSFGTAFAGKYDSIFVPNQGKPEDNLCALKEAITRIYASTLNPGALLYRRSRGLIDYDERMALLIQVVEGQKFGQYYFPQLAGVAFSHNQYRWSKQIRPEDGFVRLVWGLGTRAVDRVGNDYPRLIALSHPTLRPSSSAKAIKRYSQQYIDLINLKADRFETLPVRQVLATDYPGLRYIAQIDQDGFFSSIHSKIVDAGPEQLILTFDDLMLRTPFAQQMQGLLQILEDEYRSAVDVEFTAEVVEKEPTATLIYPYPMRPLTYFKTASKTRSQAVSQKKTRYFHPSWLGKNRRY